MFYFIDEQGVFHQFDTEEEAREEAEGLKNKMIIIKISKTTGFTLNCVKDVIDNYRKITQEK